MHDREREVVARFDDGQDEGRGFELRGLREVVSAARLEEVLPALSRVEAAAAAGAHAAGFVAYEAAPAFDPALACHPPRPGLPLLWFGLFAERVAPPPSAPTADFELGPWQADLPFDEYARRVERVRAWIEAGDSYQANLTFPLRARFRGCDLDLYHHLRAAQRARYCAYLRLPGFSILSASPELFFRWRGGELTLRPMKGTRPRGRWPEEDEAHARELLASPKERAENLMIVDLLRNDAGRVAEFGSVEVPRLFEVERYPTVHQLTSTVRARTRPEVRLPDLFRALFPCGSVTGAPKVRTTQILRELEDGPRGVYTGAVGYLSGGEAVFNVPIRTVIVDRARGEAELGVGSGITWDSEPEAEYRECLQKAAFARRARPDFELLETMRYRPETGIDFLAEHRARLAASAELLGFRYDPAVAWGAVDAEVARAAAGAPLRLRLLLAANGAVRVESAAAGPAPARLRARLARDPVDADEPSLFHKTTRREAYDARLADCEGCDEVLLWNRRGELTEFANGNLVVRLAGEDWTPPVACGLLPGTMRAALLREGAVRERVLTRADLERAEGVWRINSVRGWTPVDLAGPSG